MRIPSRFHLSIDLDNTAFTTNPRLARDRLADLAASWHEVSPVAAVRTLSRRLLRTHPLRAADALQLAAALTLGEAGLHNLPFACSDDRLTAAAEAEGLHVV